MLTFYFLVFVLAYVVRPDMFVRYFGVEVSMVLGFPCPAYLKRFSPVPSSHWGSCMLILCAVTLNPWVPWCVDCTKVTKILLLTYPHILE